MAALQGIKRRIRSVSNTRQITKAMQLVAASKLRRAQEAATGPQAYTAAARRMLGRLSNSPYVAQHPLYQHRDVKRVLWIVIAGDRGMAGAYNSNVVKAIRTLQTKAGQQSAICIGRHAALQIAGLSKVDEIAAYPMDVSDPDVAIAQPVLSEAVELFSAGEVDMVNLVYTRFHSTVRQEVDIEQLLPIQELESDGMESELEPGPEDLVDFATMRLLEAQLLQAILEARASEQAARMLAMMNATDNAKELIDDLTLAFNNARQSAITQELAEITAGAEAINS